MHTFSNGIHELNGVSRNGHAVHPQELQTFCGRCSTVSHSIVLQVYNMAREHTTSECYCVPRVTDLASTEGHAFQVDNRPHMVHNEGIWEWLEYNFSYMYKYL